MGWTCMVRPSVLELKTQSGKRPLGRPRTSCEDKITKTVETTGDETNRKYFESQINLNNNMNNNYFVKNTE